MHRPPQLQRGAFQQLGHRQLPQQLGNLRAAKMPPQQFAVVGVNHQLHQPVRLPHSHRLAAGLHIETPDFHLISLLPRLRFRKPERRHLGMAVSSAGHHRIIQRLDFLARNRLHRRNPLRRRHMSQRQLARHIPHRVDAGNIRRHPVVNGDIPPFRSHAHALQPQVFGIGLHSDSHQRLVKARLFGGAVLADGQRNPAGVRLRSHHAGAGAQGNPFPSEGPFQLLADFRILVGNQMRQQLYDSHLCAVHPVNIGEFRPDCAPAHNSHGAGNLVRYDSLPAGDDARPVHRQRRYAARPRPGGHNDIARLHPAGPAVGPRHFNRPRRQNAPRPGDLRHIILAQQKPDAPRHPVHHPPAAGHRYAVIRLKVVKPQSELIRPVDIRQDFGVFQQRFGWNAPPVQTHSPQRFPLNHARPEPHLPGPYAGHITARPAANYCHIIRAVGSHQPCPAFCILLAKVAARGCRPRPAPRPLTRALYPPTTLAAS